MSMCKRAECHEKFRTYIMPSLISCVCENYTDISAHHCPRLYLMQRQSQTELYLRLLSFFLLHLVSLWLKQLCILFWSSSVLSLWTNSFGDGVMNQMLAPPLPPHLLNS